MSGLQETGGDILRPVIRRVGYDPGIFSFATDLGDLKQGNPLMLYVTTSLKDEGILHQAAIKIAERFELRSGNNNRMGGTNQVSFSHTFRPGQKEFGDEEIVDILRRLLGARRQLEIGANTIAELIATL